MPITSPAAQHVHSARHRPTGDTSCCAHLHLHRLSLSSTSNESTHNNGGCRCGPSAIRGACQLLRGTAKAWLMMPRPTLATWRCCSQHVAQCEVATAQHSTPPFQFCRECHEPTTPGTSRAVSTAGDIPMSVELSSDV